MAADSAMNDADVEAADCRAALLPFGSAANEAATAALSGTLQPGAGGGCKLDASATIALGVNSPPTTRRAPLQSLNRRATVQQSGASVGLGRGRGTSAGSSSWKLKYQDFLPTPASASVSGKLPLNDSGEMNRELSEPFQ